MPVLIVMIRKKLVNVTPSMGVPLKLQYKGSQSDACVYGFPNQGPLYQEIRVAGSSTADGEGETRSIVGATEAGGGGRSGAGSPGVTPS